MMTCNCGDKLPHDEPCGEFPIECPRCNCGPPQSLCPERQHPDRMPIIPIKEVRRFISDCLIAVGTTPEIAQKHADVLAYADYNGLFSHGMNRLDKLCKHIKAKRILCKETGEVVMETSSCAVVDGKRALGSVVAQKCIDLAMKKASLFGVGLVISKNSTNIGMCSYYTNQVTDNGMIGIICANSSPRVVPCRAKDVAIGLNPIAFAAPISLCDNLSMDITTSATTMGRCEIYKRKDLQLPIGWIQDANGNDITDPIEAIQCGRIQPLGGCENNGGYKGMALGLMVDILSGVLSGADYGPNLATNSDDELKLLGQFFLVINPALFVNNFQERLKNLTTYIRGMEPINKNKPVVIPGDLERQFRDAVDSTGGVQYTKFQMGQCLRLSNELKVKPLLEEKPFI